ncbi:MULTISPECIES: hypothetical protein [unclassified Streptomyces]|uniref:hypothetical protein n=1 Tax=unclassified Streptomyces TaxID=2593676 RepID=UPI000749AF07|nr:MULTISPECIES: hypothetical protein [unclassified Streptomyces]KUL72030.1 hypothetical protein ADL33_24310 [Streptomyces sp. NRRL WC-3604]KUL79095.1 hypothetical protein ADL34_06070 [Streptomyces sp. NRRL WC-3605]
MPDALRSLDDMLTNPNGMSDDEVQRLRCEKVLGTTAVLLHQDGDAKAAELAIMLAEVVTLELEYSETDWGVEYYEAYLEVEPHLVPQFTQDDLGRIEGSMRAATRKDKFTIKELYVRPILPSVGADWRQQLKAANGPHPTNQARRVRVEPQHPVEDGLHFTNVWEHNVYQVLKEHQARLPEHETIGIVPLAAVRVPRHTFEPDFLITYKGRAGVIEVDGPHHEGPKRASNDHSRTDLLINAGVEWVARLDVRDTTQKAEVERFVSNFLARLTRR